MSIRDARRRAAARRCASSNMRPNAERRCRQITINRMMVTKIAPARSAASASAGRSAIVDLRRHQHPFELAARARSRLVGKPVRNDCSSRGAASCMRLASRSARGDQLEPLVDRAGPRSAARRCHATSALDREQHRREHQVRTMARSQMLAHASNFASGRNRSAASVTPWRHDCRGSAAGCRWLRNGPDHRHRRRRRSGGSGRSPAW